MFEKIPFYGQVLIFLGMALGIVAVAYWIYPNLAQDRVEIAQLEEEYAEKEARDGIHGKGLDGPVQKQRE